MALVVVVVAVTDVAWLVVATEILVLSGRRTVLGGGGDARVAPTLTVATPMAAGAVKVFGANTSTLRTNGGREDGPCVTEAAPVIVPFPATLLLPETTGMDSVLWLAGNTSIEREEDSVLWLALKTGSERVAVVAMAVVLVLVGSIGPAGVRRGATNGRANGAPAAAPPLPAAGKYDERVSATDAVYVVAVTVAIPEVKVGVVGPKGGWGCAHETGGGAAAAAAAAREGASSTRGVVKVVASDEEAS